jgi:hypothetical protein
LIDTRARYSIQVWDGDKDDFCRRLTRRFLRKTYRLTCSELRQAIKVLRGQGWDRLRILVERMDSDYMREQLRRYHSMAIDNLSRERSENNT